MRILIISYYFPPINSVASERALGFALSLSAAGHDVEVLTSGLPVDNLDESYPFGVKRIKSNAIAKFEGLFQWLKTDHPQNVQTIKKPVSLFRKILYGINKFRIVRGLGYLGRMPDLSQLWIAPAKEWVRHQTPWDIVLASYGPYSCLILGRYIYRNSKCHAWIADFRDLWTDHHLFRGLFPFTLIERRIEASVCREAQLITTVSKALEQKLKLKYPQARVETIYNGYRRICNLNNTLSLPADKINIVYAGSIYPWAQDINLFFKALSKFNKTNSNLATNLSVAFIGATQAIVSQLTELYSINETNSIVRHEGLVSYEVSRSVLERADILLYLDITSKYDGVIPCKLFDYFASPGRILFITPHNNSEAISLTRSTNKAIFVDNKLEDVVSALTRIASSETKRIDSSNADLFSRDHQNKILIELVETLHDESITNT